MFVACCILNQCWLLQVQHLDPNTFFSNPTEFVLKVRTSNPYQVRATLLKLIMSMTFQQWPVIRGLSPFHLIDEKPQYPLLLVLFNLWGVTTIVRPCVKGHGSSIVQHVPLHLRCVCRGLLGDSVTRDAALQTEVQGFLQPAGCLPDSVLLCSMDIDPPAATPCPREGGKRIYLVAFNNPSAPVGTEW